MTGTSATVEKQTGIGISYEKSGECISYRRERQHSYLPRAARGAEQCDPPFRRERRHGCVCDFWRLRRNLKSKIMAKDLRTGRRIRGLDWSRCASAAELIGGRLEFCTRRWRYAESD